VRFASPRGHNECLEGTGSARPCTRDAAQACPTKRHLGMSRWPAKDQKRVHKQRAAEPKTLGVRQGVLELVAAFPKRWQESSILEDGWD
jgi:hypothetical protein